MSNAVQTLDDLIERLAGAAGLAAPAATRVEGEASSEPAENPADLPDAPAPSVSRAPDAIDAALAAPSRTTSVSSLRDDPAIVAFRRELIDGMIRADTAHRLLSLLSTILDRMSAMRG